MVHAKNGLNIDVNDTTYLVYLSSCDEQDILQHIKFSSISLDTYTTIKSEANG